MLKAELDQLYEQNFVLKWKLCATFQQPGMLLFESMWLISPNVVHIANAASKEDADLK